MRVLRNLLMFLALTLVVAHSVSSHHHHLEGAKAIQQHASHDHHHASDDGDHHEHNPFSFTQLDDCFVTGKVQAGKVFYAPILVCYTWIQLAEVDRTPSQYHVLDVEIPPPISTSSVSFRGPPFIS